ncbi:hypothetical protein OG474_09870 [Kribbella sp. NBC_01505]|uniref:hypothetical protein n=1 Tax=Kribbella sp. NBC_01505 TaxID=2903580 RepID=UPI00386306EA
MPKSLREQRAELDAVVASFVRVFETGRYRSEQYPGVSVGKSIGLRPYVVFRDGERFPVATAHTFEGAVVTAISLIKEK